MRPARTVHSYTSDNNDFDLQLTSCDLMGSGIFITQSICTNRIKANVA